MSEPPEYVEALLSVRPIIMRRRVLWSECDPARVVYSGRFFDYMFSAYSWFLRRVMNDGETLDSHGLGTPMKAVSLEFHKMLRPDDWFEITLEVEGIRTRSFDLRALARLDGGELAFTGRISPIFVNDLTKTSQPMPAAFREKLESYQTSASSG
ncbi:acyl-CoA thioesterase [Polymorphobacter sp. PAMC 29334]|uniref:acyl-CoA thioesterase n=1 Tax=Polymorphobacter sp. PAMC 29334 TaxID=2862331 RepID=UPI001C682FC8|nr:acyl-CoA thioesterase [Polymorphobacter sp. PAMC 29334]QYE36372.1 acyl-CoA thioesterase [Polymorphobacter sp. PAMC 29334]